MERVQLSAASQQDGERGIMITCKSVLAGFAHCVLSSSVPRPVTGAFHVSTHVTLMDSNP